MAAGWLHSGPRWWLGLACGWCGCGWADLADVLGDVHVLRRRAQVLVRVSVGPVEGLFLLEEAVGVDARVGEEDIGVGAGATHLLPDGRIRPCGDGTRNCPVACRHDPAFLIAVRWRRRCWLRRRLRLRCGQRVDGILEQALVALEFRSVVLVHDAPSSGSCSAWSAPACECRRAVACAGGCSVGVAEE